MPYGEFTFIWQEPDWPLWHFDVPAVSGPLAAVSQAQGVLLGRLVDVGLPVRDAATLTALTDDAIKTSAIEGELLDAATVRSSVARKLGVDIGALAPVDRRVEGVVEMILDATLNIDEPLTTERFFAWHTALFPNARGLLSQIRVGEWRDDATGPMQVVSGPDHKRTVHYEAPPAARVEREMRRFLAWANADTPEPMLIKAALAHLWFVTIHPFDDGNGRIARAVGDHFLACADRSPQRFYSLSAEIQRDRKRYYEILERTQRGTLDVTEWILWFIATLHRAVESANAGLDDVLRKARFWQRYGEVPMNARQVKVLNRMLDGFEGKLTSSKWAAMTKCSADTALRDISQLVERGVLTKSASGGRSTTYDLGAA